MPKAHPSPLPNAPELPLPFQLATGLRCPLTLTPALPLLPLRPALWPHCPCTPVKLRPRRCAGRRRPQSPRLAPLSAAVSCCTLPERHEWGSLSPLPDLLGSLLLHAPHPPPLPLADWLRDTGERQPQLRLDLIFSSYDAEWRGFFFVELVTQWSSDPTEINSTAMRHVVKC